MSVERAKQRERLSHLRELLDNIQYAHEVLDSSCRDCGGDLEELKYVIGKLFLEVPTVEQMISELEEEFYSTKDEAYSEAHRLASKAYGKAIGVSHRTGMDPVKARIFRARVTEAHKQYIRVLTDLEEPCSRS
jgi:hypothetical protein